MCISCKINKIAHEIYMKVHVSVARSAKKHTFRFTSIESNIIIASKICTGVEHRIQRQSRGGHQRNLISINEGSHKITAKMATLSL